MSIETEIKKLQAAVVQLTDAIIATSVQMIHMSNPRKPTIKEAEPFPPSNIAEETAEVKADPAPKAATATATAPAMPGTSARSNTGPVPSKVVGKATQIPPISLADFGQKLGALAVKMGDNGAGLRELTGKFNAQHVSQIPEEKRNEFLLAANELAGGGT